ncbi:MAG: DUF4347 domain-containing protein [Cyanobacteria bacterium J06573_11]
MSALSTPAFDPLTASSVSGEGVLSSTSFLPDSGFTSASAAVTSHNRLVFVDAGLGHLDTLTQTLASERIVLIDAKEDGIQKITDVLSTQQDLLSVHILSHGASGALTLGNSVLSQETIGSYKHDLQSWGTALLGEGDLFFYGCDLAAGEKGVEFVEEIAAIAQADVAASEDVTGHVSLGGDWDLEFATGDVSAALSIEGYAGVLPTYRGNTYQLTGAGSWEAAQSEAARLGGSLVAINDAAEQAWLNSTFGTSERLWIGLSDRTSEGTFTWENGDTSAYRNWAPGEPNDYRKGVGFEQGEDYALKNWKGNGLWNDVPNTLRGNTFRGIVEIEGGNSNPPNPNPPNPPTDGGSQNASAQRIEAETAQLTGGASTNTNHSGFSGSSFVDKFTIKGAAVTFTVNTASAGNYNTTLRYANGPYGPSNNGTKDLSLYVNGVDVKDTNLPSTGTWKRWKNKTEVLNLKKGANTITYQHNNDNNGIVNLDYIWLSKDVGNGPIDVPINDFGLGLTVKKIAQLPKDSKGNNARMIGMTTQGDRTFVYEERDGHIYDISGSTNSTRNPSLFFDVGAAVKANTGRNLNTNNVTHGGLKGVAFHPEFASNGKFYTAIMEDRPSNASAFSYLSDAANPIGADAVVVEWTYSFNNNAVINNSYREVLRIGMPVYDHPIKEMIFNGYAKPGDEDYGLLYITHGDGSVQSATAGGGLNKDALGKILRINPLQNGSQRYTVPSSNPFVGNSEMLNEVYSIGHRNPHTLSFARDSSGKSHLIVGEAGRDNIEEINLIKPGGNYGWSEREGTFVHLPEGGGIVQGLVPLPEDDAKNNYVYPAAQYGHNGNIGAGFVGQAVAGGYVGANGSTLAGQYIFGDFAKSGQLYHSRFNDLLKSVTTLDANNPNRDSPSDLTQAAIGAVDIFFDHDNNSGTAALKRTNMKDVLDDEASYDGSGRADIRFGRGPNEEMYLLNKRNGYVYLITSSVA